MTEEYLDEREQDMLDYFRNQWTDPEAGTRNETVTETFTATASQSTYTLKNQRTRNVADTIDVDGTTYRKGTHYTVAYGEGKRQSVITFGGITFVSGEVVTIIYTFGSSLIAREFSRDDATLPRVVMHTLTGTENFAALGDAMLSGKGSYHDGAYQFEVRSKYANQARRLASIGFNIPKKMRHANLFRTNIIRATDIRNFDFDPDKDAYIWQFTVEIQWEIKFADS